MTEIMLNYRSNGRRRLVEETRPKAVYEGLIVTNDDDDDDDHHHHHHYFVEQLSVYRASINVMDGSN